MGTYERHGEYYIDYYVNGRRKREKVGPSKKQAEVVLNKRKVEIAENKFLDVKKDKPIRFRDFAELYMEAHAKPNKRSWQFTDRFYQKQLVPYFGDYYLHEINPLMVERYKAERSRSVTVATVNRELSNLKSIFNRAMTWEMAKENPVKKVKFFKENNERTRYLEKEELGKLLAHCKHPLREIVTVAVHTGMRKAEIQYLTWGQIDFKQGVISLERTKSGESRKVLMNCTVQATLLSIKKHPESSYVFCKRDGSPFNWKKSFDTAASEAGIEDFRFHDLRHTFASHLAMGGVDLNTIRELLGHKSIKMALRYAHLSKDHKGRAVRILDSRMDTIWTPEASHEKHVREDYSLSNFV